MPAPSGGWRSSAARACTGGRVLSDGDEIAAAIVARVAALVRARYPTLDVAGVVNRLVQTLGNTGTPGYFEVNAAAAVTADVAPVTANPLGRPERPRNNDREPPGPVVSSALAVWPLIVGLICVLLLSLAVAVGIVIWYQRRARPAARAAGR
jgi:membrane-anchored mycosin MYCP